MLPNSGDLPRNLNPGRTTSNLEPITADFLSDVQAWT
jgi:hypothetical protein